MLFRFQVELNGLDETRLLAFKEFTELGLFEDGLSDSSEDVDEDAGVAFGLFSLVFFDELFDGFSESSFLEHGFEELEGAVFEGFSENGLDLDMNHVVPFVLCHKVEEVAEVDMNVLEGLNEMDAVGESGAEALEEFEFLGTEFSDCGFVGGFEGVE